MNFPWFFDKIFDVIAPYFVSRFWGSLQRRPIRTILFLAVSTSTVATIGSNLTIIPYLPYLPFPIVDEGPLPTSRYKRARSELKRTNEYLITQAKKYQEDDPIKRYSHEAWIYANLMVGIGPESVRKELKNIHASYFRNRMKPGSSCWIQYNSEPCHNVATSWVLIAMSTNNIQSSEEMWSYLLDQQNTDGWWPLYENSGNNSQNASTYSTAVALWALEEGLKHNSIQINLIDKAQFSIEKAKTWLMSIRKYPCEWSAYPNRQTNIKPTVTISTIVTHILLTTDPDKIKDVAEKCLNEFSEESLQISDNMDVFGEIIQLDNGSIKTDSVRHQRLIWKILAMSNLYPHLSLTGKSQIRSYVEKSLFTDSTSPEAILNDNWQKAELALMLKSLF